MVPQTKEEKDWESKFKKDQLMQEGYRTQQATKPQTLSYGMMDSPRRSCCLDNRKILFLVRS